MPLSPLPAVSSSSLPSALDERVPVRFRGQTLYEVMSLSPSASPSEIRAAYRRSALKFHPDHNSASSANDDFAYLSRAHEILTDSERRRVYDETNDPFEGGGSAEMRSAEYWRSVAPKVTAEEIEAYRLQYRGSEEEVEDVKRAYVNYEGDLQAIYESVLFLDSEQAPRIATILNEHCKANISQKAIKKWQKRLIQAEKEEEMEWKKLQKDGNAKEKVAAAGDHLALVNLLSGRDRRKERENTHQSLLDSLTEKYGGLAEVQGVETAKSKRKKQKKTRGEENLTCTEPSEEEFNAIQQRLFSQQTAATSVNESSKRSIRKTRK